MEKLLDDLKSLCLTNGYPLVIVDDEDRDLNYVMVHPNSTSDRESYVSASDLFEEDFEYDDVALDVISVKNTLEELGYVKLVKLI